MISQQTAGKAIKAAYSGAVAFLGTLGTSLSGPQSLSSLHASQWVWISLSTLVAAGGTYGLSGWSGPTTSSTPASPPKG